MADDRCKTEQECTGEPWCRINGICQRTKANRKATTMERVTAACQLMPKSQLVRTIPLGELCNFAEALLNSAALAGVPPVSQASDGTRNEGHEMNDESGCVAHGLAHPCEACAVASSIEQELLALAGSDPAKDPISPGGIAASEARLRAAMSLQQPSPVPDQLAIVWRLDIIRVLGELTHKRAYFDYHRDGWVTSADGLSRRRAAPDAAAPMVPSQCVTVTFGAPPPAGPCMVCGKSLAVHGSYPTCATHPFTDDANCKYLPGARCPGAECVNGCAHSSSGNAGVPVPAGQVKTGETPMVPPFLKSKE